MGEVHRAYLVGLSLIPASIPSNIRKSVKANVWAVVILYSLSLEKDGDLTFIYRINHDLIAPFNGRKKMPNR